MMSKVRNNIGTTIVELMVALGVFSIFIAILYPSFNLLTQQINSLNDKQILSESGQRVINYLGEEIRMSGFLTGSNPNVNYCGNTVNALQHIDGNPYDLLMFLTAIPIETTDVNKLFFAIANDASLGALNITVNTSPEFITSEYINLMGNGNAMAIITFDTLAPSILQKAYEINNYFGNTIMLTTSLAQKLNAGSRIYSVRRKEVVVNTTNGRRDLQITSWDENCIQGGISENLYESSGNNFALGGIDGLQFEYTLNINGTVSTVSTINNNDLPYVRAVTIWVLFRFQFPSSNFNNNTVYILGTVNPVTVGPFNDNYRRELLTKTVEVKNLAF